MWRCHEGALRADLQRYYGVSWDDVLSGRVTVAHAAFLASNLPLGSRCLACEDERLGWTNAELLLLALVNAQRDAGHQIDPFKKKDALAMEQADLAALLAAPRRAVESPEGVI